MTTTETTQPTAGVDQAKLRERIRQELADYAVTLGVLNELESIVDSKQRELYEDEGRVRGLLAHLGVTLDGPFRLEAATRALDGLPACACGGAPHGERM